MAVKKRKRNYKREYAIGGGSSNGRYGGSYNDTNDGGTTIKKKHLVGIKSGRCKSG